MKSLVGAPPQAARRFALGLCLLALGALLAACNGRGLLESRAHYAERLAAEAGWTRRQISAGRFDLTGYGKGLDGKSDTLVVYIESDGFAWRSRSALSHDPTPDNPQGLRLALRDPRRSVLYLARPCQYTAGAMRGCDPIYWSSHRYSEAVVAAVDEAIDGVQADVGASQISLLGISGGGVVAALIAARRDDVLALTTIAANLDHATWTRHHEASPLIGSLNPADFAKDLQGIDQTHFVGGDDDIVPRSAVDAYVARMADRSRTRVIELSGFDHDCCWIEAWPGLLSE